MSEYINGIKITNPTANTVVSGDIVDGAIVNADVKSDAAISADKLADGSINAVPTLTQESVWDIGCDGSVGFTDYSSGTTAVGSDGTWITKVVWYKRVGDMVCVIYHLSVAEVNSVGVTLSFTVPMQSANNGVYTYAIVHARDDVTDRPAVISKPPNSNLVNCQADIAGNDYVNAKVKISRGQFWFKAA